MCMYEPACVVCWTAAAYDSCRLAAVGASKAALLMSGRKGVTRTIVCDSAVVGGKGSIVDRRGSIESSEEASAPRKGSGEDVDSLL